MRGGGQYMITTELGYLKIGDEFYFEGQRY